MILFLFRLEWMVNVEFLCFFIVCCVFRVRLNITCFILFTLMRMLFW